MLMKVGACPECKHSTSTIQLYVSWRMQIAEAFAVCDNEACKHKREVQISNEDEDPSYDDPYQDRWDAERNS